MLKAKILKCDNENAWYSNRIGESFEVFEQSKFLPFSSVFDIDHKAKIISNDDVLFFTENENGGKNDASNGGKPM